MERLGRATGNRMRGIWPACVLGSGLAHLALLGACLVIEPVHQPGDPALRVRLVSEAIPVAPLPPPVRDVTAPARIRRAAPPSPPKRPSTVSPAPAERPAEPQESQSPPAVVPPLLPPTETPSPVEPAVPAPPARSMAAQAPPPTPDSLAPASTFQEVPPPSVFASAPAPAVPGNGATASPSAAPRAANTPAPEGSGAGVGDGRDPDRPAEPRAPGTARGAGSGGADGAHSESRPSRNSISLSPDGERGLAGTSGGLPWGRGGGTGGGGGGTGEAAEGAGSDGRLASRGGGPGGNARNTAGLRAAVIRRLREASAYPEEVREARAEGTVTVRFRVASDGSVAAVETLRPSSSPLLNAASHDWIRRAAPYPVFSGWITVPLTFRLDDPSRR